MEFEEAFKHARGSLPLRASYRKIPWPEPDSIHFLESSGNRPYPIWHYHPELELTFLNGWSGTNFVGDSVGPLRLPEVFLLGPNLPHVWRMDPKPSTPGARCHAIVIHFQADFLGPGLMEKREFSLIARLFERSVYGLRFTGTTREALISRLLQMGAKSPLGRLIELLNVLAVMAESTECETLSTTPFSNSRAEAGTSRIDRAYQFICQHYAEPIGLSEVARAASMCPDAFSRYFKRATGLNLTGFISRTRVAHAAKLLIETNLTVGEICYASGFSTLSNFNQRFREIKSVSPRQYRQQYSVNRREVALAVTPTSSKN